MGVSKRIAEMAVRHMNPITGTRFIVVRFGNVLGSSGSVVPLFKEQIKIVDLARNMITLFYNFMDGINGIAGLTGLIGFALMAYFAYFMMNDYAVRLKNSGI